MGYIGVGLMPSVASQHERHAGHVVGNGHCVALVRETTGLPPTSRWRRGDPVQGSDCAPHTAIATFNAAGRYPNTTTGDSHAAILLAVHEDGSLAVFDQWVGHPVSQRIIRNRYGRGDAANDASRYYTIELQDDGDG